MKQLSLIFLCAIALCVSACSKDAGSEPSGPLGPGDLGKKIGETYVSAMDELVAMTEGLPPVAEVKPKVDKLKEKYVGLLVGYGKKREALAADDKNRCDREIRPFMSKVAPQFSKLQTATTHYRKDNNDFANLVGSFNTITQYANFDLLRKQSPDEMKRLGLQ